MDESNPTTEPTPIQTKQPKRDEPAGEVIVISQATVYYFVIAVVFFIAGFGVAWILNATNTGSMIAAMKSEVVSAAGSAAREAVTTAIAMAPSNGSAAAQVTATSVPRQTISVGSGAAWGPDSAKVTVVEFSDFQCPYCEMFYQQTYTQIKQKYGDKIHFVYRNFPLTSIHPFAEKAALAAECANEQGKFWEYHDTLFTNQSDLSTAALIQYASQVKVADTDKFKTCLDSQKYLSKIQDDLNAGLGYSVRGTPTFFINGNILVGAQSFATFDAAIQSELNAAGG